MRFGTKIHRGAALSQNTVELRARRLGLKTISSVRRCRLPPSDMLLRRSHRKLRGPTFISVSFAPKMSVIMEGMDKETLSYYAKICGLVQAGARARRIRRCLRDTWGGARPSMRQSRNFAMEYSAQTDRDHERLAEAVRTGRVEAASPQ